MDTDKKIRIFVILIVKRIYVHLFVMTEYAKKPSRAWKNQYNKLKGEKNDIS